MDLVNKGILIMKYGTFISVLLSEEEETLGILGRTCDLRRGILDFVQDKVGGLVGSLADCWVGAFVVGFALAGAIKIAMGQSVSKAYAEKYKAKNARTGGKGILLIGLDGAGKTTVCYQFLLGKHVHTVPTMGHNKETLKYEGKKYDFFDVGGSMLVRETWRLYAKAADAIVFVVDAHDRTRIPEAAESLKKLFFGEDYQAAGAKSKSVNSIAFDIPLLVLANKQDLADAMSADQLEKELDLASLPVRSRIVIPTDAKGGENIQAALMWLTQELAN